MSTEQLEVKELVRHPFEQEPSPLYYANLLAKETVVVNQGGTSSSKSYSLMQALLVLLVTQRNIQIMVVGATIPKLKEDVMRIAAEIIVRNPHIRRYIRGYNIQDRIYTSVRGGFLEFKSFEDREQAKGAKYDIIYINEATRIDYWIFWELYMRTKVRIYMDYNPTFKFWVHEILLRENAEYMQALVDGVDYKTIFKSVKMIRSWHVHNPYLPDEQRDRIESIRDKELWKVYARGLTGKLQGLVFYWGVVDDWPVEGVLEVIWGCDWGYTVDPTTCVRVAVMRDGSYVVDEVAYHPGIAPSVLAVLMREAGYSGDLPCYCDHDKELVLGMRREGIRAIAAEKGGGAELNRVLYVKQYEVKYTRRSVHLKDELGKYRFVEIDGSETNKIHKGNDHVIDAATMGIFSHRNQRGKFSLK
jgi:phage terminase large subunit